MTETPATQIRPVIDVIAFDCPDARALAAFYSDILGWEVEDESDDEWVTLVPPGARAERAGLAFQRIADFRAPTWPDGEHPQQAHLDLRVADLAQGEALVLAAGATRHDHQPSQTGGFIVFLDPAGHPFCLVS